VWHLRVPRTHGDDPSERVRAALAIRDWLAAFNDT
jgi:hypothetical protein